MMRALVVLSALLAIALGACGKPQPRAPKDVAEVAQPRKEPEFFDDLAMTRTQRDKVMAIIDKLYSDFAEYDRVRLVLLDATIVQIRAGELKREQLLPLAQDAIDAFDAALPDGIQAMQNLHAVLSKEQREKLVALFTEGRELTDEERRAARDDKYSKVLGLTTGQKATIYPALLSLYVKHWGAIGRFRSALREAQDEFVEDHLVASELKLATEIDLMELGEVIFDALEIGLKHLTTEQHQTLAALLDAQLRSPNPTYTDAEKPPVEMLAEPEAAGGATNASDFETAPQAHP